MDRAALVTGGSSGIGLAIARMLRDEGYGLTLPSRRPEKVQAAAAELEAPAAAVDGGAARAGARPPPPPRGRRWPPGPPPHSRGVGTSRPARDPPTAPF